MIIVLIGLVLVGATIVHEAGHWVAVRLKGGRVLGVRVGRGPQLWNVHRSGTEYSVSLLPLGGRIAYQGIQEGTAEAVVATSGAIANLVAALLLLVGGAAIFGLDRMPAGFDSGGTVDYAVETVGSWLWLLPRSVADLITMGAAPALRQAFRALASLLQQGTVADVTYFAAAVSTLWAVLNMIPVPGSDGWRLAQALLKHLLPGTA